MSRLHSNLRCSSDQRLQNTYSKHYSFSDFFRFLLSVFSVFSALSAFLPFFSGCGSGDLKSCLRFLGGDLMGDFFSGVGCSFFDDLNCFGDRISFSGDGEADFVSASEDSSFLSEDLSFEDFVCLEPFPSSSPGIPSISAHWSGGGVGCFVSSSVGSVCFCETKEAGFYKVISYI